MLLSVISDTISKKLLNITQHMAPIKRIKMTKIILTVKQLGKQIIVAIVKDRSSCFSSSCSSVVVVEEPDEEPKIYQQQAYNAKIESRKAAAAAAAAAASMMTPPLTPTSSRSPTPSPSNPTHIEHQPPTQGRTRTTRRTRYASPAAAATRMSSSSTTRSYRRRRRNKMKYRRQQAEQQRDNVPNGFQTPHYPPRYPVTPPPSMHFQQRFFVHDPDANQNKGVPQFQWVRIHQNRPF